MSPALRGAGNRRRRLAVAALAGAGCVVLALLTVFAIELSNTQAKSKRDVEARVHERSVLAAALINSLFQTANQQRAQYEVRYGSRVVSSELLDAAKQQSLYVALLDAEGHVLAASHGFTPQADRDLRVSAALALVRGGHPYGLGNVLPYGKTGVVNFAVAFPTRYGRRYLLTGVAPSALNAFLRGELRKIPGVPGSHNYVIDGRDTVLASTNPARPAGYRFTSRRALSALRSSSGDRGGYYYDQTRVANSTWRIILAEPNGPLFATVSGLRGWLPWLIFGAFALVAALALVLGVRVLRSAERDLRHANTRLAAVNRALKAANARLAHDALHDSLTGLPNRALFMDRLNQMLERAGREPAAGCAVLFIDLDRFKLVNDSLSHSAGDQLLVGAAARLRGAIRPGDTVARIGGDEFVVLLDAIQTQRQARIVVERIQNALAAPIDVDGKQLVITASIGVALASPSIRAEELLRNADASMYAAKHSDRGTPTIFEDSPSGRGSGGSPLLNRGLDTTILS